MSKSQNPKYQVLDCDRISAICFDRSGEAISVGQHDGTTSIYDVQCEQQLRVLHGQNKINCISWCRSVAYPYLVTCGTSEGIANHDVRIKNSVVSRIELQRGDVSSLMWSTICVDQMKVSDPS
jgi:WD40 repeat protein